MKIQRLVLADVKAACRVAYKEKRLGAQRRPAAGCKYDYGNGIHCSIGVAFNAATLELIHDPEDVNSVGLHCLLDQKIVSCKSSERDALMDIQAAHDLWLAARRRKDEAAFIRTREKAFLDLIAE